MALFPAYDPTTSSCARNEDLPKTETLQNKVNTNISADLFWLQNASYMSVDGKNTEQIKNKRQRSEDENTGTEDSFVIPPKKKKKHKKKKSNRTNKGPKSQAIVELKAKIDNDVFYEDKKQEKGNFLVTTLYRPAIPRYNKNNCYFKDYKYLMYKYKDTKFQARRYFKTKKVVEETSNEETVKEEELSRVTEEFNKRLAAEPTDVQGWLDYVKYQDTIYDFEKTYRNNPIGGERVTTERKLAILEKAIKSNPVSEVLLEEKLMLSERFLPADQVANGCVQELTRDPGNLTLWRALVRTTRNSMARCTVPGILQLYTRAISRINQLRVHRLAVTVEQDILALLLECGLFLQQAGLWEQLWTLLQMYLSVGLTASGHFDVPFNIDEDKLKEQEDNIVESGLPMSVLWTRVEQLRAATHFLPDPHCDSDPQRMVFTDDMAGLVQPVLSPELRWPLVVTVGVLLKVPLLPAQHCLLDTMGLLQSPTTISSVEALLPVVTVPEIDCRWLHGLSDLLAEPQFLKSELYLDWVLKVLQQCADLLPIAESVVIHCWILRIYGMIGRLRLLDLVNVSPTVTKRAKSHAKQLLKTPHLRDNLVLFTEYALMERDMGDNEKACQVLETAATLAPIQTEPSVEYVFLCRQLVQCLLLKNFTTNKDRAVTVLVTLGNGQSLSAAAVPSDVNVKRSLAQWRHRTSTLVTSHTHQAEEPLTLPKMSSAMAPHILVNWLSCHALLLTLTVSFTDAKDLLLHHIEVLPSRLGTLGWFWVEQLYETLAEIVYSHCFRTHTCFNLLRQVLRKGLDKYPNNIRLLTTVASLETGGGGGGSGPWRLATSFPSHSPLARLILVLVVRYRVSHYLTGEKAAGDVVNPYMRNILCRVTNHPVTGQCPLVWRLYLQFIAASGSATNIKQAFYRCISTCPWVKTFYTDAVEFLPTDIHEILDLIIEKELRLHTTPEELDILRG